MTPRVTVSPQLLQWACKRSQVDPNKLRKRFPKYPEWESGTLKPTHKQLKDFANFTHVPIWTLFLSKPPEEDMPIRDLRTMNDQVIEHPSSNLLDTIYLCLQRQAWYHDLIVREGGEAIPFVGSATINSDVYAVAAEIRDRLDFNEEIRNKLTTWSDALRYLVDQAEDSGILVMNSGIVGNNTQRKLDPNEFRGFALADNLAPLIFINGVDPKAAQIFTLSHELAHIWLGNSSLSNAPPNLLPSDNTERWCNHVAAELLVPKESLRYNYQHHSQVPENISNLSRHYKVSALVILRRLLDIGLLQRTEFMEHYRTEISRNAPRKKGSAGGDFHATLKTRVGKRFGSALVASTFSGDTSFTDAFHYLGINKTSTLKTFGKNLGMRTE
ncbi:MAG: ImmA/IrrE family metallo-endopeptidase [Bacteroidetes bacterium]|nr:ImmA/IrrE family metallo-endopeptidase [Bacteroidota bacterium]MCY4205527.1 ImmA/IrrE family metallo-endopeptidase [Bacteroidota bacterium]